MDTGQWALGRHGRLEYEGWIRCIFMAVRMMDWIMGECRQD